MDLDMNCQMFLKFILLLMVSVWMVQVGSGEWNASEDVASVVASGSGREALVKGLSELEGDSLKAESKLIERLLPGGDLATWMSPEQQVVMMKTWAKAKVPDQSMAYRLWRIHQLTPSDDLKLGALDVLKGLPAEVLPSDAAGLFAAGSAEIDPEKMTRGKEVYMRVGICFTCHQPNGQGIPPAFPPLAGSDWLDGDTERQIKIVLKGLMGNIEVNGEPYNGVMTPLEALLKDDEIADVLTYVRNEWGNSGPEVSEGQVKAVRDSIKDQTLPYQGAELLKEHPLMK